MKEGREKICIWDIFMDGCKDVWDFVDLVSGYFYEVLKFLNFC